MLNMRWVHKGSHVRREELKTWANDGTDISIFNLVIKKFLLTCMKVIITLVAFHAVLFY